MSYPTDDTWSEKGLECPGCGNVYEDCGDGEIWPHDGIEAELEDFECEVCGLVFTGHVELQPRWTATHPRQCDVKGYHVKHQSARQQRDGETATCLYCDKVLDCDCELWTHEKSKAFHAAIPYSRYADTPGHCKHQIEAL